MHKHWYYMRNGRFIISIVIPKPYSIVEKYVRENIFRHFDFAQCSEWMELRPYTYWRFLDADASINHDLTVPLNLSPRCALNDDDWSTDAVAFLRLEICLYRFAIKDLCKGWFWSVLRRHVYIKFHLT